MLELSQNEPSTTEEEEQLSFGVLEAQVLSLSQVVRDNSAEFIKHVHGSHVIRTLLHVLAGCLGPARADSRPGIYTHTESLPNGVFNVWHCGTFSDKVETTTPHPSIFPKVYMNS